MSRNLLVALALAGLSLAVAAAPAHAVLITVDFHTALVTGNFTFDSSIIPTGGGTQGALGGITDFASSIAISDGSQSWNSGNAGVNYLSFDATGKLIAWQVGGDSGGSGTFITTAADFIVRADLAFPNGADPENYARATDGGSSGVFQAGLHQWSFTPQPPYGGTAPEPGTLALFAPGMLALGLIRRRKI